MATPNKLPAKRKVLRILKASRTQSIAARQLGVSRQAIQQWMRANHIKRFCTYREVKPKRREA